MTYFKHTNGEAFTLNGTDYIGFFHISNEIAYTGKYTTSESEQLVPKATMLGDILSNGLEMDTTYQGVSPTVLYFSNVFDIFNKDGIDRLISTINSNNLLCYKSLVLANPTVFKYEETGGHYYGLSSLTGESPDSVPSNTTYASIKPFSDSAYWSFLDNMTIGTFVVDTYENFKYLCSDGATDYVLSGSFVTNQPLTKLSTRVNTPFYNQTHLIYNDVENSKIVFVRNDAIEIYDSSNYEECNNLILIDKIKLKESDAVEYFWNTTVQLWEYNDIIWNIKYSSADHNNPYFIKFGKNIRTGLNVSILYILNKYTSDVYQSVDLSPYGLGEIVDIDVRNTDDYIALINKIDGMYYSCFLDPTDIENTIINKILYSLNSNAGVPKIRFSDTDSNVFYVYNTSEYQSRYISNPSYPSGRLETCDLQYLKKYIWNTTEEPFNYVSVDWNSAYQNSNKYTNQLVSNIMQNGKMYMILHNIGRIYALNQAMIDRYLNSIPLDLIQYFDGTRCAESSLGLYFNLSLAKILKDTLNIYNKAECSFTLEERQIIPKKIEDFILEAENLYLNGNEIVNVVSLQRIMMTISEVQNKILSVSA